MSLIKVSIIKQTVCKFTSWLKPIQDFDIDGSQVGRQYQNHQAHAGGKGGTEGHHYNDLHRDHHYYHRYRGGGRRDGPGQYDAVDHRWATAPSASAIPPTDTCLCPPADCAPVVAPVSPTFSVSSWDSHANYQNRGVHSTV